MINGSSVATRVFGRSGGMREPAGRRRIVVMKSELFRRRTGRTPGRPGAITSAYKRHSAQHATYNHNGVAAVEQHNRKRRKGHNRFTNGIGVMFTTALTKSRSQAQSTRQAGTYTRTAM